MERRLGRRRTLWGAIALTAGLAASAAVVFAGAGGAAGDPSAADPGFSAQRATARAAAPVSSVDVSSLPQARPTASRGQGQMPLLSPLGTSGLAQARAAAPSQAPHAEAVVDAPQGGPSTPGAPLFGWDGLADSPTVCSYFGAGCEPPDHAIASDGSKAVQLVNTSIDIYNATTGAVLSGYPKSLQAFFNVPAPTPAGCDAAHANQPFLSDPRVMRDPVTGRWYAAALQVESAFGLSPSCDFVSMYHVAVSKGKDPTGGWRVYHFNTANLVGTPSAADYTQFGFDSEALFIGGNQFNQAGTAYDGAWTLAIPKATAEAGGAIPSISGFEAYTVSDGTASRLLDTVQPVVSYGSGDGGPAGEFLIASFNESITESKVVVFDFSNALSGSGKPQQLSHVVVGTKNYSQPPQADNYPSCTNCLETIDNRISATPVYMHGNIYAAHDTAVNNDTAINANVHWLIVHPVLDQTAVAGCTVCSKITGKTKLVEDEYLTFTGTTDDWFAAIQPDREGNLFMGFEYGSTSGHVSPSSRYVARRATAPAGADWGDLGAFLKQAANATTNSRWGDYEAVAFEGWDANTLLFATEYAGVGGDWATHIDRVAYTSLSQR